MKKRLIVIVSVIVIIALGFIIAIFIMNENLKHLAGTEVSDVNLSDAKDGDYIGRYSVFPVSAEVKVTILNRTIQKIDIIKHVNGQGQGADILPGQVIKAQSIQVDCVSGATYSSKVILKAIQNALLQAQP